MSVKVTGWVWDQPLPTSEKIVLLKLADHAHHDGSNVYPSVAEIARDTGLSERQVQRYLSSFVRRGVLAIDGNVAGGRGKTRVYRFTFQMGDADDTVSRDAKGDTHVTQSQPETVTPTSPLPPERVTSDAQKGDTGDAKRVTPKVLKGDIHARANQNRQEPSLEPSGNRERGQCPSGPHRLPPRFTVTDAMYDWAADEFGLLQAEVDRETEMFRDHFAARGDLRVDWLAEWRKWIRRSDRFRMQDHPSSRSRPTQPTDPPDDMTDEEAERFYLRDVLKRKGA